MNQKIEEIKVKVNEVGDLNQAEIKDLIDENF